MSTAEIKNSYQIKKITEASAILSNALKSVLSRVAVGVTPLELDSFARTEIKALGASPSFLGYQGFPAAICVSIDSVVIHGIPTNVPLAEGQLVGIDCGVRMGEYYSDAARTVAVGDRVDPKHLALIAAGEEALEAGIAALTTGKSIVEYSRAAQSVAQRYGVGIIREYCGHGVGLAIHEEPSIPNYVVSGIRQRCLPGMVLALEPMYTLGNPRVHVGADNWSVITKDRSVTTHCEHTVLITDNGAEPLTRWE